jgi:hypothetical protein
VNIPHAWRMNWYMAKARAESKIGDVRTALWFVQLGWRILRGRLLLMDIRDSRSNGGYKYRVLVLSHRPVSSTAPYDF